MPFKYWCLYHYLSAYSMYWTGQLSCVVCDHCKAGSGSKNHFTTKHVCLKLSSIALDPGMGWIPSLINKMKENKQSKNKTTSSWDEPWDLFFPKRGSYCLSHDIKMPAVGKSIQMFNYELFIHREKTRSGTPASSASLIGFWQTCVPDLMRFDDMIAVCHCLFFYLGVLTKLWFCSTKDSPWELQLAALKRRPYLISAGYFKRLSSCFPIHLSVCHLVSILLLRRLMSPLIKTQKNGCNRWFSRLRWTMSLRESSFGRG